MRSLTTIGVSIARDYDFVYDFLATPKNIFTWADSLGTRFHAAGPLDWVAEEPRTTRGPVTLRFMPRNSFGVVDVRTFRDGAEYSHAPARLLRNGDGCELTIGVWRGEEQTDAKHASDVDWARADLLTLKTLLEGRES